MTLPELIILAIGLSMDCFAVSLSLGATRKLSWKDILVMSALFGFFQGFLPIIGWLAGSSLQTLIESVDHWIAFGILALIGLKMIKQAVVPEKDKEILDFWKFSVLLTIALATSIDALIAGVGFGLIGAPILRASMVIATITFLMSMAGAKLGARSTFIPPRWAEFFGGVVLIGIGLKILLEHLALI